MLFPFLWILLALPGAHLRFLMVDVDTVSIQVVLRAPRDGSQGALKQLKDGEAW